LSQKPRRTDLQPHTMDVRILVCSAAMRRMLASVIAVALVVSPRTLMAHAPASDVLTRANGLAEAGRFAEAGRLLRDELQRLPESPENRARRNLLATQSINAYTFAFMEESACSLASDALIVARDYLKEFMQVYGVAARTNDEYNGVRALRDELERDRVAKGCPTLSEPVVTPPPEATELNSSAPVRPPRTSAPSRTPLAVGLGVSAGLAATMLAVSLGTGLSRAQEPFQGAAFTKIHEAAKASYSDADPNNNVDYGQGREMCSVDTITRNPKVADACAHWSNLGTVAIATGVVAGVFVLGTAVFTGLLARHKRRHGGMPTRFDGRRVQLGAAPRLEGGWTMAAALRF